MIEVAFRNILTADETVGPLVGERVYFITRPQDDRRTCIILNLVSQKVPDMCYGGADYSTGRMQISCLAPTYPEAKALAQAARSAIDGFTGVNDGSTIGYILVDSYRDIPVLPLQSAGLPATFGVNIDAMFMVKEL